jgi:hypothetical protein
LDPRPEGLEPRGNPARRGQAEIVDYLPVGISLRQYHMLFIFVAHGQTSPRISASTKSPLIRNSSSLRACVGSR